MKRTVGITASLLLVTAVLLASCQGASSPFAGKCNEGVCVKVQVTGPVQFDEPAPVSLQIDAERDIPGLQVALLPSDPDITIAESGHSGRVDVQARKTSFAAWTVRFPKEGDFTLKATAALPGTLYLEDVTWVRVTRAGVTVNPTFERTPGQPAIDTISTPRVMGTAAVRPATTTPPVPTPPTKPYP